MRCLWGTAKCRFRKLACPVALLTTVSIRLGTTSDSICIVEKNSCCFFAIKSSRKTKTANLGSRRRGHVHGKDFFVIPARTQITSSETLVSEKAPWRSPSQCPVLLNFPRGAAVDGTIEPNNEWGKEENSHAIELGRRGGIKGGAKVGKGK